MTVCPRGSTSGNITKIIKILGESPSPSRLTAENIEAWLTSNAAQLDAATQLLPPEHRPFALTLSSQTFARSLLLCLAALLDANADDCHFKHLNDLQARISSASASRQLSRYRSVLEDLVRLIGSLPDLDPSLQSTAQEAIKIDLQFMAAWFLDNHPSLDSVTTFIGTYLQDERQELVNFFQTLLDLTELKGLHALLLETQLMLAKLTGLVPRGLVYDGDVEFERDCTFVHGQYGSIWRGTIEGQVVTIKPVRRPINRPPQLIKSYAREAILWGRLDHPNIAPFYGMYLLGTGERRLLSVITPWMSNGNVLDYLSRHPVADRTKLILDVCHGLNYLHAFNPPVIHGNLKSTNVLITPRGRACLTDIGFHMPKPKFDYRPTAFCWRFSAPEILFAAYPKPSTSSDVYALGSVCYEIFSPHPRFSSLSNPSQLLDSIRDNKPCLKPDRMDLNLWEMVQRCWDPFPQKRPSMGAFLRHVSMQIATVPRIPNGMEGWDARLNPRFLEPPSFSIKRPSNLLWLSRTLQVVEDVPRAPEVTQFSEWLAADAGYLDSVICFFPREHREFASDLTKALFPRLHLFCLASILAKPSCENAGLTELFSLHAQWSGSSPVDILPLHGSLKEDLLRIIKSNPLVVGISLTESVQGVTDTDVRHLGICVIHVLVSDNARRGLLEANDSDIGTREQNVVDLLHSILDIDDLQDHQPRLLRSLLKLSHRTGLFPKSLVYTDVTVEGTDFVAGGSFGDVWRGTLRNRPIAVKTIRSIKDGKKMIQAFSREAVMWSRLNHPNVLPFLGVYFWRPNPSSDLERVSLLSPWMERGNVLEFLERYPSADKTSLLLDIANGLHHLHSLNPPVVHGDLKGNNILVTSAGTACLADFGLSKLVVDSAGQNSPVSHSCLGGNELFCAPEILGESSALQVEPTASSDVYSFGCVGYQIFTGRPRFAHITAIWPRLHAAKKNRPIPQPTNMPSMLWKFTQECWAPGSGSRPCTADLITSIVRVINQSVLSETVESLNRPKVSKEEKFRIIENTMRALARHDASNVDTIPLTSVREALAEILADDPRKALVRKFLKEYTDMCLLELTGHSGMVSSVSISNDGQLIVSGSMDLTIRRWDASTGKQIGEALRGHTGAILSVALSPDGRRIISASSDSTIRIWSTITGEEVVPSITGHDGPVRAVSMSRDGSRIVSACSDHTIGVWDADTGKPLIPLLKGHERNVLSVAVSHCGTRIVSGSSDRTIRIWDGLTGIQVAPPLKGHKNWVQCVALSPDASTIVSGSSDNTIRLWDARTGEPIRSPWKGHTDFVKSVAFTANGEHVLSASSDNSVRIWAVSEGEEISAPLRGHTDRIWSAAISEDGRRIVSGSFDESIRLWDAELAFAR